MKLKIGGKNEKFKVGSRSVQGNLIYIEPSETLMNKGFKRGQFKVHKVTSIY